MLPRAGSAGGRRAARVVIDLEVIDQLDPVVAVLTNCR